MPRREAPEEEAKDNSLTAIAVCRRTHAPTMLGRSSDAVRLLHASSESLQGATRSHKAGHTGVVVPATPARWAIGTGTAGKR